MQRASCRSLLLAVDCLASLGVAARFPQVDDPICYSREAGHDPACCCRLAFGRLLKRTLAVSPLRAPAKKRPRRGKRSLTLDATRSLPREDPPRVGILLLLNCDGLFPDFEGLQGVSARWSVRVGKRAQAAKPASTVPFHP